MRPGRSVRALFVWVLVLAAAVLIGSGTAQTPTLLPGSSSATAGLIPPPPLPPPTLTPPAGGLLPGSGGSAGGSSGGSGSGPPQGGSAGGSSVTYGSPARAPRSPKWLVSKGRHHRAATFMFKLRKAGRVR